MSDLIDRQKAIDAIDEHEFGYYCPKDEVTTVLNDLPSAQPDVPDTNVGDIIYRQAAIDAHCELCVDRNKCNGDICPDVEVFNLLPAAQPESISEAYAKAVWTWLLDYQIKTAELEGRYTPYEVLSWVANDWRKEHE